MLVHEIRKTLPFEDNELETILAFHAITGCDSVSYFCGHTKKTAWDVFLKHYHLLMSLGKSKDVTEQTAVDAETFMCHVYNFPNNPRCDQVRVTLFCRGKTQEMMPPTSDSLRFHINRANYQTLIWRNAHVPVPEIHDPTNSGGWQMDDGQLKPVLKSLPPIPMVCKDIVSCGCKKGCIKNCACKKSRVMCTPACKCFDSEHPCKNKE